MRTVLAVLGVMIVTAVAGALLLVRAGAPAAGRPDGATGTGRPAFRSTTTALVVVTGLVYLNQVLFTLYVLRVHGGDPSFIARHVPDGWFTLAHGPALESLARHFPAPALLAPSVLRVNAFLELPLVVLAYLTVCGWLSRWAYERALGLLWPMSLSYTVTFCLIEWRLYNQFTVQDTVLRALAAVVVPLWAPRLSPAGPPGRTDNLPGLLVFVASTVGLGVLGLVVYDTALLYNLGHLDTQLPLAAVAVVVVAAARVTAPRVTDLPPGRGVHSIGRSMGWLLVLAAVPALPIRYGLNFGARYASVAGALLLFAVAAVLGARDAFARTPGRPAEWLLQMGCAVVAGLCTASVATLVDTEHAEGRLLVAGSAGVVGALLVCGATEVSGRRPSSTRGGQGRCRPRPMGRSRP